MYKQNLALNNHQQYIYIYINIYIYICINKISSK